MEKVSINQFQKLLEYTHPLAVSIYLSTEEVGPQANKREAEYNNLAREVREQLEDLHVSEREFRNIVSKMEMVGNSDMFWDLEPSGFAFFFSPDLMAMYQLPISVSNLSLVSYRFHLKPLIRLLTQPCDFYLLSLSKKAVELYKGDCYNLEKCDVPNMPQSFAEVVGVEMNERSLQFHTGTRTPNGSGRPAIFHGSSSWKDDKHKYLNKYLQEVDQAVTKYLEMHKAPLIVTGVERMDTEYRQVNTYRHFLPDIVLKGNREHTSLSLVHKEALRLLEPYFLQQEKEVIEKHFSQGDTARFSTDLDEILKQTVMGRVDTLLVAQGIREWGKFNPDTLDIIHTNEPTSESHDLLDLACVKTLQNGGRAYVLPPEHIPLHSPAAAVFRYSVPEGSL